MQMTGSTNFDMRIKLRGLVDFLEDSPWHTVEHGTPRHLYDLDEFLRVGPPLAVRLPQVLIELLENLVSVYVHSADLVNQRRRHVLPVDDLGEAVPL